VGSHLKGCILYMHVDCGFTLGAGDCRAVLCRGGSAIQLNREHSAEVLEERQRIEAAGGKLREVMGSWRIGDAGLQVTR